MTKKDFMDKMVERSGLPAEVIHTFMLALPDVLLQLQPDEKVRTSLGVFRKRFREARSVRLPKGGDPVPVQAEEVIKLKPGKRLRLRKKIEDPNNK